eukprot:6741922-Prymnesium_polylepis.1
MPRHQLAAARAVPFDRKARRKVPAALLISARGRPLGARCGLQCSHILRNRLNALQKRPAAQ